MTNSSWKAPLSPQVLVSTDALRCKAMENKSWGVGRCTDHSTYVRVEYDVSWLIFPWEMGQEQPLRRWPIKSSSFFTPQGQVLPSRLSWLQEDKKAKNKFSKAGYGSIEVQSKYLHKAGAQIKISANNLNQAAIWSAAIHHFPRLESKWKIQDV